VPDNKLQVDTGALAAGGQQVSDVGNDVEEVLQAHLDRLAQIKFRNDGMGDRLTSEFEKHYKPEPLHDAIAQIARSITQLGEAVTSAAGEYAKAEGDAAKSVSS
jgi:hypothetical protein